MYLKKNRHELLTFISGLIFVLLRIVLLKSTLLIIYYYSCWHTKKRDCVLLFLSRIRSNDYSWEFSALRGSGIALYSEQATPKSTPNMYAHACTYKYTRHKIYISWGHQLLQCLGIKIEFTRFRKAKNKALRTPFRHKGKVARFDAYIQNVLKAATGVFGHTNWLSERGHFPPPKPRRWTFDCKYTTIFWIDKEKLQKC